MVTLCTKSAFQIPNYAQKKNKRDTHNFLPCNRKSFSIEFLAVKKNIETSWCHFRVLVQNQAKKKHLF